MNRYAKIKADSNTKSRSMEELSADLKSCSNTTHHSQSPETHEINQTKKENTSRNSDPNFDDHQEQQDNSKIENGFGEKLTRSSSVASNSASQQRFRLERAGSRRVKGAFSMRRSSSVSERYCRIHNQCVTLPSPTFDDGDDMDSNNGGYAEKNSSAVKSRSEKFLRVCKRFLRL